jgi:hypothetical protein
VQARVIAVRGRSAVTTSNTRRVAVRSSRGHKSATRQRARPAVPPTGPCSSWRPRPRRASALRARPRRPRSGARARRPASRSRQERGSADYPDRARELHAGGMSCPKVAAELGVPFGTAKLWLWPEAQKRRRRTWFGGGSRDGSFKASNEMISSGWAYRLSRTMAIVQAMTTNATQFGTTSGRSWLAMP